MEDLYKELSNTNIDSERINYILSLVNNQAKEATKFMNMI